MKLGNIGPVSGGRVGFFVVIAALCNFCLAGFFDAYARSLEDGDVVAALGDDVIVARELVLLTLRLPTCMHCAYLRYPHTCTL